MTAAVHAFMLNETIVQAVARLVDDAGATREPSHGDLHDLFARVGLIRFDPHQDPAIRVGKQKRVRQILRHAMDEDPAAGSAGVTELIAMVRGLGGFRVESPNYCGEDPIASCVAAFDGEPVEMTRDGLLRPRSLDALAGRELTAALRSYVTRAQGGYEDSVLVAGTDKDLIEATAAHVLTERYGAYSSSNFPTLVGQAFLALGLHAQHVTPEPGGLEGARIANEVALYELACAINRLRNKAGSGHGRPFLSDLTVGELRAATEGAGLVAGRMLDALDDT